MRNENPKMVEICARIAHQLNKAVCESQGDNSQVDWDDAPENIQESAKNGVEFVLGNPFAKPSDSHENWLKFKKEDGWKYGPVKDAEKKEHPCFVPYNELPPEQKLKDYTFKSVVLEVAKSLGWVAPGVLVNHGGELKYLQKAANVPFTEDDDFKIIYSSNDYSIRQIKHLRQVGDAVLQNAKTVRAREGNSHETNRQSSLAINDLESFIMRNGMVLKSLDVETHPSSKDPSSDNVEPTADGMKM